MSFQERSVQGPAYQKEPTDSLALSEYPSSLTCVVHGLNLTFWYCYCPGLFLTRLALTGRQEVSIYS